MEHMLIKSNKSSEKTKGSIVAANNATNQSSLSNNPKSPSIPEIEENQLETVPVLVPDLAPESLIN